jgi:hypothetical protein
MRMIVMLNHENLMLNRLSSLFSYVSCLVNVHFHCLTTHMFDISVFSYIHFCYILQL